MIKNFIAIVALGLVGLSHGLEMNNVATWVNEWSTISKIHSNWTNTSYYLSNGNTCNGSPYFTLYQPSSSTGYEEYAHKRALLLSAFNSQLPVALRCENGKLTDFLVSQ